MRAWTSLIMLKKCTFTLENIVGVITCSSVTCHDAFLKMYFDFCRHKNSIATNYPKSSSYIPGSKIRVKAELSFIAFSEVKLRMNSSIIDYIYVLIVEQPFERSIGTYAWNVLPSTDPYIQ